MIGNEPQPVHTVEDFYDGPLGGYADFEGRPHTYEGVFDRVAEGYCDEFVLREASAEEFAVALELWAIWLRWDTAYHGGQVDLDSHPCLPTDRPRFEILRAERQRLIEASVAPAFKVAGRMFLDETNAWRVVWTRTA